MTYEENMKLVEAAKVLMEYGKSRANGTRVFTCPGCLFQRINEGGCCLKSCPCDWTIPTVTRWAPEDVALAKALKAVGAELIYRSGKNEAVYWRGNSTMDLGVLPANAFINMGDCESLLIDTIIREAEE